MINIGDLVEFNHGYNTTSIGKVKDILEIKDSIDKKRIGNKIYNVEMDMGGEISGTLQLNENDILSRFVKTEL